MSDPIGLSPTEEKALREQATIDVVSVVCTTIEMVDAGHDPASWIAEQAAHWTGDHARVSVLLLGLMVSTTGLSGNEVALMGKLLLDQ